MVMVVAEDFCIRDGICSKTVVTVLVEVPARNQISKRLARE